MTGERRVRDALRFLLAHHGAEGYDHTLGMRVKGRQLRICARCFGVALGCGLGTLLLGIASHLGAAWFSPPYQLVVAALPAFAVVDWSRQALRGRGSTNPRRLLTGSLVGFAISDLAALARSGQMGEWQIGMVLLVAYLAATLTVVALAARGWDARSRSSLRSPSSGAGSEPVL